jgi:hypothetical protein
MREKGKAQFWFGGRLRRCPVDNPEYRREGNEKIVKQILIFIRLAGSRFR